MVVGKLKLGNKTCVYEENVYDKMRRKVGLPLVRNYVRYVMIYVYGIYDRCMYIDVYIYIHRKAIAHATRNTHPTYDEFSVDAQNDALDGPLNNMSN